MTRKRLLQIALPLLIIIVGFAGMRLLVSSRQAPQKAVRSHPGTLVEVLSVAREDRRIEITATGTVQPRQEISIIPQVSGRVVKLAPSLVAGGFFKAGELLLQIEDIDYRLAVEGAEAALAKAEVEEATVKGQARVARLEWERLDLAGDAEPSPLVLYEPQLKNAQANVASARATLQRARLDLERTQLYAPFNSRVRTESVDLGQYLRAGTAVATLASTDAAEIVIALPHEDLRWLTVPGPQSQGPGSPATVALDNGDGQAPWPGRIVRSLGEVDPRGRMSRIVVQVEDPYGLAGGVKNRPQLDLGAFVRVTLHGQPLPEVVAIPRSALRDDSSVWLADSSNRLRIVPVQVLRLEAQVALVQNGLQAGDRLILTNLSGAADGMPLRILSGGRAE